MNELSGVSHPAFDREGLAVSQLLTVPEAARRLGLSRAKLYQLMESGELVYVKFGRSRRIPLTGLAELVARNLRGGWHEGA